MSTPRRAFTRDFKIKISEAYQSGTSAVELSRQFDVHPNLIYAWAREYQADPIHAFESQRSPDESKAVEQRIAELERLVGRQSLEIDFLKKALTHAKSISLRGKPGNTKP
jgi:transposase-like protein